MKTDQLVQKLKRGTHTQIMISSLLFFLENGKQAKNISLLL